MTKSHKKTNKLITAIIVAIMLCNFVMPNLALAASTENGGSFLEPLAKVLCAIPDAVNNILQKMFISVDKIEQYDLSISNSVQSYKILFSPGIIFAGKVPAFDINFLEPGNDEHSEGTTMNMVSYQFFEEYCDSYGEAELINWINSDGDTFRIVLRPNGTSSTASDSAQTFSLIAYDETGEIAAWEEYKYISYILDDNGGKTTQFVKHITQTTGTSSTLQEQVYDIFYNNLEVGKHWEFCDDGHIYFQGEISEDTLTTQINGKTYEISRMAAYDSNNVNYGVITSKYNGHTKEILRINDILNDMLVNYTDDSIYQLIQKDIEEKLDAGTTSSALSDTGLKSLTDSFISQVKQALESKYPNALGQTEEKDYYNTARILQPIVATWYRAFRRIALVGLLSVLVYIGIKILQTSTSAKDKAKYKKMFKDWLIALCLLFALHYIMSLAITVVNQINSIIGSSLVGEEGEDVLLTTLRNNIHSAGSWSVVITEVVIYCVITVFTVMYTIQYIRRVIYLAFLTMIAPLITLTYPLDKIKDSKAQAFDMWLKDYIFFTLLQVVHLLLYYILVGQSLDLANKGNWLFAIVAIGFLTKAEKIMKEMFGFKKSKSMGALAAGATGALVMNAINKLSQVGGPGKGISAQGGTGVRGNSKGVRTVTTNPLAGLQMLSSSSNRRTQDTQNGGEIPQGTETSEEMPQKAEPQNISQNVDASQDPRTLIGKTSRRTGTNSGTTYSTGNVGGTRSSSQSGRSTDTVRTSTNQDVTNPETGGTNTGAGGTPTGNTQTASAPTQGREQGTGKSAEENTKAIKEAKKEERKEKIRRNLNGARSLLGRYGKPTAGKLAGIALGGAGAMIGFASGVAQGDIGKAMTGLAGGAVAGYNGGQKAINAALNVVPGVKNSVNNVKDTYNMGARGEEYVQNARFDRELKHSSEFRRLMRDYPKTTDKEVSQMLDAGITDVKKMRKILKKRAEHPRKFSIDKAIAYSTLAEKCPDSILYNKVKFIRYFQDREIQIKPEEVEALRKNIVEFK